MFVVVELSSQETVGAVRSPLGLHSERIEHRRAVKLEAEVQLQCVEGHRRRVHLLRRVLRRRRWRFRHREHVSLRKRRRLCRAVATGVSGMPLRASSERPLCEPRAASRHSAAARAAAASASDVASAPSSISPSATTAAASARVAGVTLVLARSHVPPTANVARRPSSSVAPSVAPRSWAFRSSVPATVPRAHRRLLQRDVKRGRAARGDERRARRRVG